MNKPTESDCINQFVELMREKMIERDVFVIDFQATIDDHIVKFRCELLDVIAPSQLVKP